jgi:toxin CcdB
MARQHELFRAGGTLVVVIQSDLLEAMQTRVAVPLLPEAAGLPAMRGLNPLVTVEGRGYRLMPQLMATLTLAELGPPVGSVAAAREDIVRAVDMLLAGV